ncbi:MAG TPA: thiamine phosphate synthase [Pyrinomonadaceae bacterium]|nr:thiamine phosphate synthase [Pyrinomonadaceae bacterium]
MPLNLPRPISYAITSGATTAKTTPDDPEFAAVLRWVEAAVAAQVSLIQIREKLMSVRVLYELARRAAAITLHTPTKLLINDRFDIVRAAGADGVHLTTNSLPANLVREICGQDFLIGVSTHSLETAQSAAEAGADFIVFGPVFETESKRAFGPPQGLEKLREVSNALAGFPVLAIGGINAANADECLSAGASGIAGISLFQ